MQNIDWLVTKYNNLCRMGAGRYKSGLCLSDSAGDKLFPIDVAGDIDTSAGNVLYAKSMTLTLLISTSALHLVVKRIKAR